MSKGCQHKKNDNYSPGERIKGIEDHRSCNVIERKRPTDKINLIEGRKGFPTGNIDSSLYETLKKITHHGSTSHEQSKNEGIEVIRSPYDLLNDSHNNSRYNSYQKSTDGLPFPQEGSSVHKIGSPINRLPSSKSTGQHISHPCRENKPYRIDYYVQYHYLDYRRRHLRFVVPIFMKERGSIR